MGVTRDLNTTAKEDGALRQILSGLERELRDVNTSVAHKQQQLEDYLTSGFTGRTRHVTGNTPQDFNDAVRESEADVFPHRSV